MARRGSSYRKRETLIGRIIGIGAIIGLVGGGIFLVRLQKIPALSGGFADVGSAGGSVINAPINAARNSGNYIGAFFTNANEVRKLRAENKALLEWRDSARAIAEKLETYEKLNNIASSTPAKMLNARLVAETNGPFAKSAIVNIGSNQGIATNWIAVNEYGMIGRVVSVGKDSARVLLLTDSDSRLPIMGETTRGRAILIGDKTDAPRLEHLNIPALIAQNERVLTSGDDGIIPRGVAIGQAAIGPDGKWRVRLAISAGAIDYVKLIAPNYLPAPQEKINGYAIGQGMVPVPTPEPVPVAGAILPLDAGAASVPNAQTPQAIAQAQELRKLKAELEAAKKGNATSAKPVARANPLPNSGQSAAPKPSVKPKPENEKFQVKVVNGTQSADANKDETPSAPAPKSDKPENADQ